MSEFENTQFSNTMDIKSIKKDVNKQIHQHLSTIFVVVGIVSFTLGAIVNYYTIRRLTGGKV